MRQDKFKEGLIRKLYKAICRKLGRYPKWHSVVVRDVDGKSTVYLDDRVYLVYGHILSWSYKKKLKKHPFCLLKPNKATLNSNSTLTKGLTLCNLMDKPPE